MHKTILPPYEPTIERAVLSAIIRNPALLANVEDSLNSECFYLAEHQLIFNSLSEIDKTAKSGFVALIQSLVSKGGNTEITKLAAELKNEYASDLDFFGNVNLISELSIERELLARSFQVQSIIEKRSGTEQLHSVANEMADIVARQNREVNGILFSDSVDEMIHMINSPRKGGLSGINTGLGKINGWTDGWQNSDVIIIAGRPGMGKTVAGAFHALKAAQSGIPTAYVSLEVPKWKMTARMVSSITNIGYGRISKRDLTPYEQKTVTEAAEKIKSIPLYYYDYTNSWDINDIAITLRSWKRKYGIGLVIVDYIQLLRDRTVKDSSDMTKVVTSSSIKMKQLQSQMGCPIIELAQLNRENESKGNKRPSLENLKSAGQLEQDASTVIMLYRSDYYEKKAADESGEIFVPTNDLEYIFTKNREGGIGSIALKCKPEYNQIYEEDLSNANPIQSQAISKQNADFARNKVFEKIDGPNIF